MSTDQHAVIIDSPRWWADFWQLRDSRPVTPAIKDTARQERRDASDNERRGLLEALEALPAGAVIVHTATAVTGALVATWATEHEHPTIALPAMVPGDPESEQARNQLATDVITGLADNGWCVSALLCAPGDSPAATEVRDLHQRLSARRVPITRVHPWVEPEPEPEPEAEADPPVS